MMWSAASILFPALMILAATGDVLSRRIPNIMTVLVAVSCFALAWPAGLRAGGMALHAGVGLALLMAGFLLFSFRLIGGGDAKLLAAAGVWLGLDGLAAFLTFTVLAGGLMALAILAWSLLALDAELRGSPVFSRLSSVKPSLPYGYAIAAGAILAFPESWWGRMLAT